MSTTFQLVSDLHLEQREAFPVIVPRSPNLLLCGDISNHEELPRFFSLCSRKWKNIFFVPGNHEFYSTRARRMTYTEIEKKIISDASRYDNIFYMNNTTLWMDNEDTVYKSRPHSPAICIIGSTLWSKPKYECAFDINDFFLIYKNSERIHIGDMHRMHETSVQYITERLEENKNINTIVLTHFPPTVANTTAPLYTGNHLETYFTNRLDDLILSHPNISYWLFGHTHWVNSFSIGATRLITNAIGYSAEQKELDRQRKLHDFVESCIIYAAGAVRGLGSTLPPDRRGRRDTSSNSSSSSSSSSSRSES